MPVKPYTQDNLSINDIVAEFGGTQPYRLCNYYAGGSFVPAGTCGFPRPSGTATLIPSSGTLSFNNFFGASKLIEYSTSVVGQGVASVTLPAGTWYVYTVMVGAGGGGGGSDSTWIGGSGGSGLSSRSSYQISSASQQSIMAVSSNGGGRGLSNVGGGGAGLAGRGGTPGGSFGDSIGWTKFFDYENKWTSAFLIEQAVWHGAFDSGQYAPIRLYFPQSGNYTLRMSADDALYIYDSGFNLLGQSIQTWGAPTPTVATPFISAGWQTLNISASNFGGGVKGVGFTITAPNGSTVVESRSLPWGGTNSGGFWFLNGGSGGHTGTSGNSGAGGGGGGASAVLHFANSAALGSWSVLGIAPGGGGGFGTGRPNPITFKDYDSANWQLQGTTNNFSAISGSAGPSTWWTGRAAGDRVPYRIGNFLTGMGSGSFEFYPPNPDAIVFPLDNGGGGGGGAPGGYPGGIVENGDQQWIFGTFVIDPKTGQTATGWNPPYETQGAAGSAGFHYFNPSFVLSSDARTSNVLAPDYGYGAGPSGNGADGGCWIRISNVNDGIYPVVPDLPVPPAPPEPPVPPGDVIP